MRHFIAITLVLCGFVGISQPYNNEWIKPALTYYKFPVRTSQLCRIPKATLTSYGIGEIPAEQFQLWKDGKEVPIYTSEATGPLSASGFIEFFGKQNDGIIDSIMYPQKWYQPNASRSLFSDTSWYFLTINPAGPNKRLIQTINNVATTTLPADSFYNFRGEQLFPQGFNDGFCIPYEFNEEIPYSGTPIRSSVFDRGEGWFYTEYRKSAPTTINLTNLRIYPKATTGIKVEYKVSGYKGWSRNALLYMNDSLLSTNFVASFEMINPVVNNVPLSRVTNFNNTSLRFTTDLDDKFFWDPDRNFLHSIILSYQRTFNFNTNYQYEFSLPANANGNHLRISNFRNDGLAAILYDFTNGRRYLSVNKTDTTMYLLEPSLQERNLVVLDQHSSRTTIVTTLNEIHFPDLSQIANQGDYLIISSKLLSDYNGTDFVEAYRAYRSSLAGGSYKAKIHDIEELSDMFAFGIRKHPLAVKNFIRYAHDQFVNKPRFVFLIGHGTRYIDYRTSGSPLKDWLNMVPTYGMPASDNMLASADNINMTPLIPVGRLSAVNGKEVKDYLDKVKEFEALDKYAERTPENKEWKKNVIQLVGGDDAFLSQVISNFMNVYSSYITDTLMGASVKTYERSNNDHFAKDMYEITDRINKGAGLVLYFGHSSATSIDFSMNGPEEFKNTGGHYPVFIANGCRAGNMFDFSGNRINYYGQTISDKFIFAPKNGAIGFISNTDISILNYMHLYTSEWYRAAGRTKYGKGLGEIQQSSIQKSISVTGLADFFNRQNCEQILLHGDPAIVLTPEPKPDYATIDSFISIKPLNASVAEDTLLVKVKFVNLGKSVTDSVWAEIKREYPDGREQTIATTLFRNLYRSDSMTAKVPIKGIFDRGTNYISVAIDPANEWDEMTKSNNVARIPFEVSDEEIRPVFPYQFSIMNQPGFLLTGSTVNVVEDERTYRIQIDTTELFNSQLLYQQDTVTIGGAVSFNPSISWTNNRVYYWRLAPVINGQPVNWRGSSFQYIQGVYPGWGQSHYFQHKKSNYVETTLSDDRVFNFGKSIQSLYIVNSVYGFSGYEDNHFSITLNGQLYIRSACVGHSIIFNVFDTLTFKPWDNSSGGRYGSGPACDPYRKFNFEFSYVGSANRKLMMDFLDSIPKGLYVTARMILDGDYYSNGVTYFDSSYTKYWQRDTLKFGSGKSLYHSLVRQGFYNLDSVNNQGRTFIFVFRKDDSARFKPISRVSEGLLDRVYSSVFPETVDTVGAIISPKFGPAKVWNEMHWMGHQYPGLSPESSAIIQLIGVDKDSNETVLKTYTPSQWVNDISFVSAAQFPYIRLKLLTQNNVKAMPYQLDYWRLFYEPIPDGALSARDHFVFQSPVLVTAKDSLKIELAFKNISKILLDSTHATLKIGDRDGIIATYDLGKLKSLQPGDTAIISFKKSTVGMLGKYYALIEVNKEQDPREQFQFNNFTYIPFEVATALPNTLTDFNARASQRTSALLSWKTTNEIDLKSYTLEHGGNATDLKFLQEFAATNNRGADATYNWEHLTPIIGKNFYRLKMTYNSGKIEYSPVRQVVFGKSSIINAYPNPFANRIWVAVNNNEPWTAELFNAAGQKLLQQNGAGNQFINTQSLPNGTYMLRITSRGETTSIKLDKHDH